jgi:hypothetical protein
MNKRSSAGQEAVEFILISVLVFFGAIFSFFVFGDKLANFFQNDSAVAKTAGAKAKTIASTEGVKFSPDYKTTAPSNTTPLYAPPTVNIGGYDVLENTDGSFSFEVAGQNVVVPAQAANLTDIVFETTGSSSKELLIAQLGKMIAAYKAANPSMDAPINMLFGSGSRMGSVTNYTGTAIANTIAIQIGENVSIIQKDQTCNGSDTNTINSCSYTGTYIIEGKTKADNTFTGYVTSKKIEDNPQGNYTAIINSTDGLTFTNGQYSQVDTYNDGITYYDWNIDFTNPDQTFAL